MKKIKYKKQWKKPQIRVIRVCCEATWQIFDRLDFQEALFTFAC